MLEAVGAAAELACVYTGRRDTLAYDAVVLVTARLPEDGLIRAPSTIAMAVYAGHSYAEELDAAPIGDAVPFRRELTDLAQEPLAEAQLPR